MPVYRTAQEADEAAKTMFAWRLIEDSPDLALCEGETLFCSTAELAQPGQLGWVRFRALPGVYFGRVRLEAGARVLTLADMPDVDVELGDGAGHLVLAKVMDVDRPRPRKRCPRLCAPAREAEQ